MVSLHVNLHFVCGTPVSVYRLVSVIFDFMLIRFYVAVIVWFRPSFIGCIFRIFYFFTFLYFWFL